MLHSFYLVTTALMLLWYLLHELWASKGIAETAASELAGGWNKPKVKVSHQANVPIAERQQRWWWRYYSPSRSTI